MLNELMIKGLEMLPQNILKRVAGRYIAGETKDQAIALALALRDLGFASTIDLLGEDAAHLESAERAITAYLKLIEAMTRSGVERNVSIKLTHLGLRLDRVKAFDALRRVLEAAASSNFFVRIDMEDASVTDLTIDFYRRAREIWPKVGVVLQARLKRTIKDAKELSEEKANIRLCKGIYPEKPAIALFAKDAIREAYLHALEILIEGGCYVGIASHDIPLVRRALESLLDRNTSRDQFEFQALLGVPIRRALEALRDEDYKVRLYIPYGDNWRAYSLRRFRENPQIALSIAKSLLNRDRFDASRGGILAACDSA